MGKESQLARVGTIIFFQKKINKRPYFFGCTVEKLGENNNKEGEMWWRTRERVDLPNTVEEVVIWLLSC